MTLLRFNRNKIRTTETKKKADRLFETVFIAMALVLALNSTDVFADTAPNTAADLEARRHAMLQAWLYEDHTRIINEQDRRKYKLPPLGTPEATWWELNNGAQASIFSRAPLSIAGEGPDPVIPSPFNFDEAWRRVSNE